jgi:type IV pilus assembly protein PilN
MIRVNLLKPEHKEISETPLASTPEAGVKKKPPKTSLIFLFLIVAIIAFYFFQNKNLKREQGILNSIQEEKQQYRDVAALLTQVEQQKSLLEKKINLINTLKANQHAAVNIMDELSLNIPDWVWLVEMGYDGNQISIKGKALSNTLIADYIFNLEKSPSFSSVNLISSTLQRTGGNEYIDFSLTASCIFPPQLAASDQGGVNEEQK